MIKITHICLVFIMFIALSCKHRQSNVVANVKEYPITISELQYWMLLEKANVYNYFYQKNIAINNENFWTLKQGNEIPLEKLKEIALQKAKRCKVQQIIAMEKGLIETCNFDEIISKLDIINKDRKSKAESGEPIYGPVQFTPRTYFFRIFDKMEIELKHELSKHELKPGKNKLEQMMNDSGDDSTDRTGFFIMQYVDQNYDRYIDEITSKTMLKINKTVYEKITL